MKNFLEKRGCAIIVILMIVGLVILLAFPQYFQVFLIVVGIGGFVFSLLQGYTMAKTGEQDVTLRMICKDAGITLAIGVAGLGCGWVALKLGGLGVGSEVRQYGSYQITTTPGPSFIILLPFMLVGIVGTATFIGMIFNLITSISCYLFKKALSA